MRFVRAYFKREVEAFRVEVELHGSWPGLPGTNCLPTSVSWAQGDFRFVDVNWRGLDSYIRGKFRESNRIAEVAREHSSIHDLLSYLSRTNVSNPYLFLQPSEKNNLILWAFDAWREGLHPGSTIRRT